MPTIITIMTAEDHHGVPQPAEHPAEHQHQREREQHHGDAGRRKLVSAVGFSNGWAEFMP